MGSTNGWLENMIAEHGANGKSHDHASAGEALACDLDTVAEVANGAKDAASRGEYREVAERLAYLVNAISDSTGPKAVAIAEGVVPAGPTITEDRGVGSPVGMSSEDVATVLDEIERLPESDGDGGYL